jgi:hypothetical protein
MKREREGEWKRQIQREKKGIGRERERAKT